MLSFLEIDVPASIRRELIYNLQSGMAYSVAIDRAATQLSETYYMRYDDAIEHVQQYAECFGYT